MSKLIITVSILAIISSFSSVNGANLNKYIDVCGNNKECSVLQGEAYDLWRSQHWESDLKKICGDSYIKMYSKNYSKALECVYALQVTRQEYHALQSSIALMKAEAARARAEASAYRRGLYPRRSIK